MKKLPDWFETELAKHLRACWPTFVCKWLCPIEVQRFMPVRVGPPVVPSALWGAVVANDAKGFSNLAEIICANSVSGLFGLIEPGLWLSLQIHGIPKDKPDRTHEPECKAVLSSNVCHICSKHVCSTLLPACFSNMVPNMSLQHSSLTLSTTHSLQHFFTTLFPALLLDNESQWHSVAKWMCPNHSGIVVGIPPVDQTSTDQSGCQCM